MQVAQLLKEYLPDNDLAARWGGEEFLILLLSVSSSVEVAQRAEELRTCLATYNHPNVGQVTASLGIASTTGGETPETLIARADAALYRAKQQGRNRVCGAEVSPTQLI
ncbi:GGDEF domain-containing protein [Spirulina subsalsa]|uniref:GGDEF domain-containing protein n=1 Tax=Spirulina subsalsa TaxID=54311 RepID=UPI0002F47934|nr:GGDEF domain-containing protein [Spirulina subsalsa]